MATTIIEWSSRRRRNVTAVDQRPRWYKALVAYIAVRPTVYTSAAHRTDVVGARTTSTRPSIGDTNAAISWETPRWRGLTGGGTSIRGVSSDSSIASE